MIDFIRSCIQLDPMTIIRTGGYLGIAFIIFSESGILAGIFFPGDSLLFAAGLLAASGYLHVSLLIGVAAVAAILGDTVGYWSGAHLGRRLFERPDSHFFKRKYLVRTERFYERYGGRAVLLARFVPIVRTVAPILAGASLMPYRLFLFYNVLGGALWVSSVCLLGFFIGTAIPDSAHYLLPLSLVIIAVSFLPIALNLLRTRGKAAKVRVN